jgi:hypothetical protein
MNTPTPPTIEPIAMLFTGSSMVPVRGQPNTHTVIRSPSRRPWHSTSPPTRVPRSGSVPATSQSLGSPL